MKVETYQCDICGKQKQKSNHWRKACKVTQDGHPAGVLIAEWDTHLTLPAIPETQAYRNFFDAGEISHLCGAECVSQWLSKNLL